MTITGKPNGRPPGPELNEPETPLEWALYYAARGNRVLPLYEMIRSAEVLRCACSKGSACDQKPGKHPRTTHGLYDATTDQRQIRHWWTQWPAANIGIRTGDRDLVLDVDIDKGGDESLEALESKYGKLPVTRQALTGSGGRHHWFRLPKGVRLNCTTDFEYGLDTRADNGYVVCAPSNHLSGNTYCWDGIAGFNERVADIPQWLLDKLLSRRDKTGAGAPWAVIDIVVNRHPELPQALMNLIETDLMLSRLWNLRRPDFVNPKRGDPNFSKYDAGLASHFAKAGLPHQQIADVLTAFRLKHGNPKGKGYRLDYLKRTIHFAVYGDDGIAAATSTDLVPYQAPPTEGAASAAASGPKDSTPAFFSFWKEFPAMTRAEAEAMDPVERYGPWMKYCSHIEYPDTVPATHNNKQMREAAWALLEFEDYWQRHGRDDVEVIWESFDKLDLNTQWLCHILHATDQPADSYPEGRGPSPEIIAFSALVREAVDWLRNNLAYEEARTYLYVLLQEAQATGKADPLFEARFSLARISDGGFSDFKAAVTKAVAESDNGLRVDLRLLNKARNEALRELRHISGGALAPGAKLGIILNGRQLPNIREDCAAALRQNNDPPRIFQRQRDLVRFRVEPSKNREGYLERLENSSLTGLLADAANFYFVDSNGKPTGTLPPVPLVNDLLTYDFQDPLFPFVEAIVRSPIVREDGTILTQPGYDAATHMIYHPPPGFELPPIPAKPTEEQIEEAKRQLRYLVTDFKFEDKADRTNFFGFCLTPLMRPQMDLAPLCIFDAPVAGAGKGLLTDLASIIATGEEAAIVAPPTTQEEWPKLLSSLLDGGRTFIIFDNLRGILESAALEAVLTKKTLNFRVLGHTKERTVPNRATWGLTGNNVTMSRDMARRCFRVCIDPQCSQPHLRKDFKQPNLARFCKAERANLLAALLVLIRAWYAAGKPDPGGLVIGTYTEWKETIGGILKCAGFEDFLANQQKLYRDMDLESEEWETFLLRIEGLVDAGGFTISQVVQIIERSDIELTLPREVAEIYRQTVTHEASRPNRLFATKLGHVFRSRYNSRFGSSDVHLERIGDDGHNKVARYAIRRGKS